ncbi:hypothetical protein O181_083297 [Austropuccinia psidii MF-1]|uniref:Uncharacterized protein n=1 Tax=Austropuccinia psidii MF-1 TaxID=1389203 RepID=A0A9Q3IJZ4_9BASI|nr:hypothetical protein [Austropuccinia psidii MF-1]
MLIVYFKTPCNLRMTNTQWCPKHSKGLQAVDPDVKTQMSNQKVPTQFPGELEPAVKRRCNKDRTLDDIANTLQEVSIETYIDRYDTHKTGDKMENKTLETKEAYDV